MTMDEDGMCLAPVRLPNQVVVNCGVCRWCMGNRVNDFAGRAFGELQFSSSCLALTLTYAKVPPEDDPLPYHDVQLCLKRLRNDGYSVRYMCAGEYGEKKGRAHWHIILFFRGGTPPMETRTNFYNWKYWPHGYTYAQSPDFEGITYVLKYTLKDDTSRGYQKVLRLSKKPPIGYEFFLDLAQRHVDAGLPVHSPAYAFAGCRYRTGRPRQFWLVNRSRELFLEAYVEKWRERWGTEPPMTDFLVEKHFDPIAARELDIDDIDFAEHLARRPRVHRPEPVLHNDPVQVGFLMLPHPKPGMVFLYSDGRAKLVNKEGAKWPRDFDAGSAIDVMSAAGFDLEVGFATAAWIRGRQKRERTDIAPAGQSSTRKSPSRP